jgi:hypothetical protein
MKWIPSWIARSYCILYFNKKTDIFEFEEAKNILGIEDKRKLSKILTQLKERGFLISKRDPVDPRRKLFKLIDPESIVTAFAIQNKARSKAVIDKLKAAKTLNHVLGGAYAAYKYHRYAFPGKIDLYINKEDLGIWIALLSEKTIAISIDDIPSEKAAKEHVHIHSNLTDNLIKESTIIDGLRYLTKEYLIVQGLKQQDKFSLTDALAILIAEKDNIDWKKLLNLADGEKVTRELGCCLDLINLETRRIFFPKRTINQILKKADFSYSTTFPSKVELSPFSSEKEHYQEIGKRWNLKIYLSKAFVSKIVLDLIRR